MPASDAPVLKGGERQQQPIQTPNPSLHCCGGERWSFEKIWSRDNCQMCYPGAMNGQLPQAQRPVQHGRIKCRATSTEQITLSNTHCLIKEHTWAGRRGFKVWLKECRNFPLCFILIKLNLSSTSWHAIRREPPPLHPCEPLPRSSAHWQAAMQTKATLPHPMSILPPTTSSLPSGVRG